MCKNYECSFCGKEGVKLWRPYGAFKPLVCAECAETRQSPIEYYVLTWKKEGEKYIEEPTGEKLPLPKWIINEKGRVPNYRGPGPNGIEREMTDQLIINLKDVGFDSGKTALVPAVPYENYDDQFWTYGDVPQDKVEWWENFPTK
ncbi:MAG: hypothetical protein E7311_01570 [Clostridiales bacterium]|nr:hypothetical protein [Clostridiales bacterium]